MKKRWQLTALYIFLMQLPAESQKLPSLSDLFIQQADTFVIEPSWTIPSLLNMKTQEFEQAWGFFIKTMIHYPERLIAAPESLYSERKNRNTLIEHCSVYNTWLTNLFVCLEDGTFFFSLERPMPVGHLSIFDYARQHGIAASFYDFYVFYFDRIAADYIESVNNASLNSDHADFGKYKKKAQRLLSQLYVTNERLQGSEYEARYGAQLKTYQDIFQMLMAEKRTMDDV